MIKKIMMSLVLGASALSAVGQYQLPNSDFEEGFVVGFSRSFPKAETKEPKYWHGFPTMNGSNASVGRTQGDKLVQSTDVRPNSKGTHSVYIKATEIGLSGIYTQLANGVMTSGRVNSDDTNPDNAAKNYNYSPGGSYSSYGNKNNHFNPTFEGKPDAMKVWVKFVVADATKSSSYPYASVNAVLHNSQKYQDPESQDYSAVKIASATDTEIGKKGYDSWQELNIPFVYNTSDKLEDNVPAYMLVSFSTNAKPGGGTNGDMLYIDDLEFVYNSELSSAVYDGVSIKFDASNNARVNKSYNASLLTLTSNGVGATVSKSYNAETGLLTVVVSGNNISEDETNQHTYAIQFDKPKSAKTYTDKLSVSINGSSPFVQATDIVVYSMPDGTYAMALNNFNLAGSMPVGNIFLTGLNPNVSNLVSSLESTQTIQITAGDDENYGEDDWLGPTLGDVPVVFSGKLAGDKFYCNIDIDMQESLGQTINVVFGTKIVPVTETAAVASENAGVAHVVLDRAFNAGWNTVCLPFAYTASEIAEGAEAQEFKAVNGNWLTFDVVEGELEPNKPYLINVPEAVAAGKMFENKTIVVGAPASVSNGTFTFTGVYEQKDMDGLYGVATVNGETKVFQGGTNSRIMGTRAYFETTDKSVTSLGVAFNGETTSISTIITPSAAKATGVYNVQGIKLNNTGSTAGLPAGLYIVNGQKVLVK